MTANELQPDVADVLQEEPYKMAVQGEVSVCGPVRTQELPRKAGATKNRSVSDTTYVQMLDADPRRGFVLIVSMDADLYYGFSETSMQATTSCALIPKGVPITIPVAAELWVKSAQTATSTRVSVTTGLWAAG